MLYEFGLLMAILFILFGIDDLVWDVTFFIRYHGKKGGEIPLAELDQTVPKLLAVMIAAWKEDGVLTEVMENLIASAQYPRSMYHVFLGVYPNDEATLSIARDLEKKHSNIHVIVNVRPGPTSKADNLNHVLRQIKAFEEERGWSFGAFIVHDAEDVVHPNEFKLENYLIDRHDALQFPVFPLQQMPRLRNIFRNMTVGTYADEFAENHYLTLTARDRTAAFVPSAGTGFALSRRIVASMNFDGIFPEDSLTEDYKLSLSLKKKGCHMHYVLEAIERLDEEGRLVREFVSTRSRFPGTFRTAVKQKTRWIYGITMQSFRLRDVMRGGELNFVQRYSLYKDWKAKFGNILIIFGYIVFAYFLLSLFFDLPAIYPAGSFSWYLCVALTIMMLERQFLRAFAIKNVYGWKSTSVACFLPPLLPLRLVWGNIINFVATVRAWKQHFLGIKQRKRKGRPAWDKTDHAFLAPDILRRFHRKLGDLILEKELVAPEDLRQALDLAKKRQAPLGAVLRELRFLGEEELVDALARANHTVAVPISALAPAALRPDSEDIWRGLGACLLLETEEALVVALSEESPVDVKERLSAATHKKVEYVFSTIAEMRAVFAAGESQRDGIALPVAGQIEREQTLLALAYQKRAQLSLAEVLTVMGLPIIAAI